MLAIRERVSPCSARCSARSVGRVTSSSSPSWRTSIERFLRSWRSPRGPATRTTSGSIVTVTPGGTGMGFLPMRDIDFGLPDLGDDLAADTRAAGVVAGHHAVGGRDDGGAHAAEHLGHRARVHVGPLTGARDALEAGDHGLAALRVLQPDDDAVAGPPGLARDDLE